MNTEQAKKIVITAINDALKNKAKILDAKLDLKEIKH